MFIPSVRITRRVFVASTGATVMTWPAARALAANLDSRIELWPGSPPGGGGPQGDVFTDRRGAVSNLARPCMEVFLPRRPSGAAVLVAGGGGYKRIEMRSEAYPAARWLNDHGIAAFVLSYRLPSEGWNDGPAVSLQDAQRAVRLMRANAGRFQFDPDRVGALGFSAGGHLMGMVSVRFGDRSYTAIDDADSLSARPDAAALIYPVITLEPPYDRTSTRRSLIGDHPDAAAAREWSVQTHVGALCPPMFLVQAEDDPVSNPENTRIMAAACERAGVPVEMHRFSVGGHGFGMGRPGTPTTAWPAFYAAWLRARKFTD